MNYFRDENSFFKAFSSYMRRKRFKHINKLIISIITHKGSCNILDIGGSEYYWDENDDFISKHQDAITITIANLDEQEVDFADTSIFTFKQDNACNERLYEEDYDLIHSNSLLEHVGDWDKMQQLAKLIRGKNVPYYVQTPNYWFPVEPHFRFIGFQWLPISWRARILMKRQMGFRVAKSFSEAMESVESIKLVDRFQISSLFPDAKIVREKVGPLTKSFMAISD